MKKNIICSFIPLSNIYIIGAMFVRNCTAINISHTKLFSFRCTTATSVKTVTEIFADRAN